MHFPVPLSAFQHCNYYWHSTLDTPRFNASEHLAVPNLCPADSKAFEFMTRATTFSQNLRCLLRLLQDTTHTLLFQSFKANKLTKSNHQLSYTFAVVVLWMPYDPLIKLRLFT
jgi:hypothetical protein